MTEKLTKVFTRDFSLFVSQWWRTIQSENFVKEFGTGYTDTPSASNGLAVTYFYLEKDWEALSSAVIKKLVSDPGYYSRSKAVYLNDIEKSRKILKELKQKTALDMETVALLKQRLSKLYPGVRLTLAIPSFWKEKIEAALGGKADGIVKEAYDARAASEGVFEDIDATLRRLCSKRLEKFGQSPKLAKVITADELEKLANDEEIDWREVKARTGGYTSCKGKLYLTRDYLRIFRENGYFYEEEQPKGNEVKGTVAFGGGLIRGKVRKIFSLDQLGEFQEGEVLVTPMTVPDFVPVMKKSKAIVTDEGGMSCHAAIVSREMKIPCVVGTRVATKLFETGDGIEVDSNSGVVKKL